MTVDELFVSPTVKENQMSNTVATKKTIHCFRCNANSGNTSKVPAHWGRAISNSRIVLCCLCRYSKVGETWQQHEARVIAEGKGAMELEQVWPRMIRSVAMGIEQRVRESNSTAHWNHIVSGIKANGGTVTVNGVVL